MFDFDSKPFQTLLAQLHKNLNLLEKLHQDEVEEARHQNLERRSKTTDNRLEDKVKPVEHGGFFGFCTSRDLPEDELPMTCADSAIPSVGFRTRASNDGAAYGSSRSSRTGSDRHELDAEVLNERLGGMMALVPPAPEDDTPGELVQLTSQDEVEADSPRQPVYADAKHALAKQTLAPAGDQLEDQQPQRVERNETGATELGHESSAAGVSKQLSFGAHNRRQSLPRMRFRRYHMKQLWFDHGEFDNIFLSEVILQQREKECENEQDWGYAGSGMWVARKVSINRHGDESRLRWFLVHPESKIRTAWVLVCLVLLLYDFVMMPIRVCFEPRETTYLHVLDLCSMLFWTADIPLTFITGVRTFQGLELRPAFIARMYLKSWFMFDVALVLLEWFTYVDDKVPGRHASLLRMFRWARVMRLLRLARVLRIAKMKSIVRQIAFKFQLSKVYMVATRGWVGLTFVLIVVLHFLSCFWYAFSFNFDNGWVFINGVATVGTFRAYTVSLHWSISRIHGLMSIYRLETTIEILVDALLLYFSFALASAYIGTVTAVCSTGVTSKTLDLWHMCVSFIQRHQIPSELSFRMQKVVEASHFIGPADIAEEESTLLQALPQTLQHQLIFEARRRILITNVFFLDLVGFSQQTVGHLCNAAVSLQVTVQAELIFSCGDACSRMLFIDTGKLAYGVGRFVAQEGCDEEILRAGASISEPTLWTNWENMGTLLVLEESAMLSIDSDKFAQVIIQHRCPCMHAVRYAKHFVRNMNSFLLPSDLTSFPQLTIAHLDDNLFHGTDEDHFMFISHYKVEAGTEATLMRDGVLPILQQDVGNPANDLRSPIFIDSEDLSDLARLKEHVIGSASLVLLLTPGVLSRPWCLIEIVTAIRHRTNIVLVEVQRPGCSYRYPDEEFYESIRSGQLVSQQGQELLAREGVLLGDVEDAIRQVFLKIALPFSPHKSKTIREAELRDIVKRCQGTDMTKEFSDIF